MTQSLHNSIVLAVFDGKQREWNDEEVVFLSGKVRLQEELFKWSENSINNGCWHPKNYELITKIIARLLPKDASDIPDELIDLPF
jgi:hypothetical protein